MAPSPRTSFGLATHRQRAVLFGGAHCSTPFMTRHEGSLSSRVSLSSVLPPHPMSQPDVVMVCRWIPVQMMRIGMPPHRPTRQSQRKGHCRRRHHGPGGRGRQAVLRATRRAVPVQLRVAALVPARVACAARRGRSGARARVQ